MASAQIMLLTTLLMVIVLAALVSAACDKSSEVRAKKKETCTATDAKPPPAFHDCEGLTFSTSFACGDGNWRVAMCSCLSSTLTGENTFQRTDEKKENPTEATCGAPTKQTVGKSPAQPKNTFPSGANFLVLESKATVTKRYECSADKGVTAKK